jgi:hypothetical protein
VDDRTRIESCFAFGTVAEARETLLDLYRSPQYEGLYTRAVQTSFHFGRADLFQVLVESGAGGLLDSALKSLQLEVTGNVPFLEILRRERLDTSPLVGSLIESGDIDAVKWLKPESSRALIIKARKAGFADVAALLEGRPDVASSSSSFQVPALEPFYNRAFLEIKQAEDEIRAGLSAGYHNYPEDFLTHLDRITVQTIRVKARTALAKERNSPGNPQRLVLALQIDRRMLSDYDPYASKMLNPLIAAMPAKFKPHFLLAGGMVTNLILGYPVNTGRVDNDLFLIGEEAERLLPELLKLWTKEIATVTRSAMAITLEMKRGMPIQFVLRIYSSPEEVLIGFDVDAACCCFFQDKIWATPRCIYALETMELNLDISRMSTTYNQRLLKYSERKLFTVVIPVPVTFAEQEASLSLSLTDSSIHSWSEMVEFNWNHRQAEKARLWEDTPPIEDEAQLLRLNTTLVGLLALYSNLYLRNRHVLIASDYEKVGVLPPKLAEDILEKTDLELGERGFTFFIQLDESVPYYRFRTLTWGIEPALSLKSIKLTPKARKILEKATFPVDRTEFVRSNPGSQHTASFHPVDLSWDEWVKV